MPSISEKNNLGDLVKYEEESLRYSREQVTVAAGETLELGAVVGRVSTSGKIKRLDPAATDGTENAFGVLLGDIDATLIDRDDALILARHGVVASTAVVWPAAITTEQKAIAAAQLEVKGVLIRQSA